MGLELTVNLVGQENPGYPGRTNRSPKQETSLIYVTCTHSVPQQREGGQLAWHMVCVTPSNLTQAPPGLCQREAAAKAGKVKWRHAANGLQGVDATSITTVPFL